MTTRRNRSDVSDYGDFALGAKADQVSVAALSYI